ncbi:MAG TPA: hypothetical protein VHX59_14925 [Mycobacteriales bacterium]|nr:hypothetical protein [Mycobacteriales bacterium]
MYASPGELLILLVVVGVLILVLRWVYRPSTPRRGLPPRTGDFGLLRTVSSTGSPAEAAALRAVLSDAGIRSTTDRATDGQVEVLVFADDVERARLLLPPA